MNTTQKATVCLTIGGAILLHSAAGCSSNPSMADDGVLYRTDRFTMYADSLVSDSLRVKAVSASAVELYCGDTVITIIPDTASTVTYGPVYRSDQPLIDAMYAIERPAVTARDPFTIATVTAITDPRRAMADLRSMLGRDGLPKSGAWPVIDTSAAWIIAAGEIYAVTGNRQWLHEALPIAERSIRRNVEVNYDSRYGLMRGTMVYSDGSAPYIPAWMTGSDRLASLELGLNATYVAALKATAMMADEAGEDSDSYRSLAESMALTICNRLWIPEAGYFSSMLYGSPYPIQSHAVDHTAQAITILAGTANEEIYRSILTRTPMSSPYLPPTYPEPSVVADATTPSLRRQALFGLASADAGYTGGVMAAIGSVIHASVMQPAHYNGALSALVLRAIAGMTFGPEGITFSPSIPADMQGDKSINGLKYRDAELNVTVHGTGSSIGRFMIDGKLSGSSVFPAGTKGHHDIDIYMMDSSETVTPTEVGQNETMPMLPVPKILWQTPCRALITNHTPPTVYNVIINGLPRSRISEPDYTLAVPSGFTTVAFEPVAADNTTSGFTMRPYRYFPPGSLTVLNAEEIGDGGTSIIRQKKMARRFVELTSTKNSILTFTIDSRDGGRAFIELQYADGTSTARYVLRRITLNGRQCGVTVMPRLYAGPSTTGLSTLVPLDLTPGENVITIDLQPDHTYASKGSVLLDKIRIINE